MKLRNCRIARLGDLPKPHMNAPKRDIPALNPEIRQEQQLNDRLLRLIGIPFFGIAIPNFIGLFGRLQISDGMYWLGNPYFIFVAFVIWQGNRWLLFKQREHHNWFSNPVRKLINLVSANVFYTAPVTVL